MVSPPNGHQSMSERLSVDNDVSLDYFLGQQLGQSAPFKSITLGVASNFQGNSEKRISLQPGGIPN